MTDIIVIAHNIRSTHNVGSLLRTSDGLGASHIYLTGYTPHPGHPNDSRLPHEIAKITQQISKTALGAEQRDFWTYEPDLEKVLQKLQAKGYAIIGLEQHENAIPLSAFEVPEKVALIVGREVEGIEPEILKKCNPIVEIKMYGKKESFNVVQAAAMALYHCRFYPFA